ncbi:5'-nucleotidase domain-containing protein 1 [Fopius arisanus]|uniref:5'-nucleotidase domain-containing protein 1 n=1 Tax=Fopius arisanus TaxID=64838 RepID=A0A9R1UAK7_9HYME|nr:PREDICTED: 5'-nucleotidase domain-containing protein 1 [Fopius arisanus]
MIKITQKSISFFHKLQHKVIARGVTPAIISRNRLQIRELSLLSKRHREMSTFKFSDYDCIGFDLDNTILWYNITNMVEMEYQMMAKFLVENKGYDPEYLEKPLTDEAIDFLQKGLILDFDRGNILKTNSEGIIRMVSHGTKFLTTQEIGEIYPNQKWEAIDLLTNDPMAVWNGPWSLKVRALMDYFDMPFSLIFARIVDSIDSKRNEPLDKYEIWPDLYAAACNMFERTNFRKDHSHYFTELKKNPNKYFRKCSNEIVEWIREIKKERTTFLITGSNVDFANFTATHTIGEDWKSLFDVVVCFAKKPGFFVKDSPFWTVDDHEEKEMITGAEMKKGGVYSQGNWGELKSFLGRLCKQESPRCLYVGDNLLQDVQIPSTHVGLETVVVSEELHAEGMVNIAWPHPDEKYLVSSVWGSYFSVPDGEKREDSHWSTIVESYSRICIPSLKVVAHQNIDDGFQAFDGGDKTRGFHPAAPAGIPSEIIS